MNRFKPGQEVVCVGQPERPPFLGPAINEIVIVGPYGIPSPKGVPSFEIARYNRPGKLTLFPENFFEPLADITELKELLETEPQCV